ncbi:cell division protein zapB [Caudoviricetes sp.]|nr:cell division protein zapB [Caudoviricetes sp.]
MGLTETIELAGVAVFFLIGVLAMGWFRVLKETNTLLKEQNEELRTQNAALKGENKEWVGKHVENEKRIAQLQGQIDTLTKIPLDAINTNLTGIKKSNGDILAILKRSKVTVIAEGA